MPNNANSKFKADTFNVLEFMGPSETGFVIPIYQRSYSWKTAKVFDLLNDIIGGVSLIKENSLFDEYTYIGGIITTNGASHTTLSVQKKTPKKSSNPKKNQADAQAKKQKKRKNRSK